VEVKSGVRFFQNIQPIITKINTGHIEIIPITNSAIKSNPDLKAMMILFTKPGLPSVG
jgi:hypothetical protein